MGSLTHLEPRISIVTLGVTDLERSHRFYSEGLRLPSTRTPESGIIFFQTTGTCLAFYPLELLAVDVSPDVPVKRSGFSGITLAHNARTMAEVDRVLAAAENAGARW